MPQDIASVINDYISKTRGWSISEYRIEERSRNSDVITFAIVFLSDAKRPVGVGGKSFELHYDPSKRSVVKELAYQ